MTIDELMTDLAAARENFGGDTEVMMYATGDLALDGYERISDVFDTSVTSHVDRTGGYYPACEEARHVHPSMRTAPARTVLTLR